MVDVFVLESGRSLELDRCTSAKDLAAEICRLGAAGARPAIVLGFGRVQPTEANVRQRFKKVLLLYAEETALRAAVQSLMPSCVRPPQLAVLLHPDKQKANAQTRDQLSASEAAEAFNSAFIPFTSCYEI